MTAVNLLGNIEEQRIYGVNNNVRRHYKMLRGLGVSAHDARMMVIGACVTLHCSLYGNPYCLHHTGAWEMKSQYGNAWS